MISLEIGGDDDDALCTVSAVCRSGAGGGYRPTPSPAVDATRLAGKALPSRDDMLTCSAPSHVRGTTGTADSQLALSPTSCATATTVEDRLVWPGERDGAVTAEAAEGRRVVRPRAAPTTTGGGHDHRTTEGGRSSR